MANKKPFFYQPKIQSFLKLFAINIAIILFFVDITLDRYSYFAKKGLTSIDSIIGFYGIIGISGSILLIVIANILGKVLKVDEEYYANDF